jgi:hypothetical protein
MNPRARNRSSTYYNQDCADFMTMAERELSAFFHAVTQLFGPEQAKLAAEDWLHELSEIESLPASTGEWRLITAKASTRFFSGVNASSSSSLSAEFTNA